MSSHTKYPRALLYLNSAQISATSKNSVVTKAIFYAYMGRKAYAGGHKAEAYAAAEQCSLSTLYETTHTL